MMRMRFSIAAALLLAACAVLSAAPKQMSVTVQQTQVRDKPSYLGKTLGVLAYGDRITVLDQPAGSPKGWLKVQGPDGKLQGWVNASALVKNKITLAAGSQNVESEASSGEVVAAGKGFNSDVEAQYKKEQKLDYTWVDKMEKFAVSPEQVSAFLSQGGLQGGAQ